MADHKDEVLTDNTKIHYCKQCEHCVNWGNNAQDFRSNMFDKICCDEYPYPNTKPQYVIDNSGDCPYRSEKRGR